MPLLQRRDDAANRDQDHRAEHILFDGHIGGTGSEMHGGQTCPGQGRHSKPTPAEPQTGQYHGQVQQVSSIDGERLSTVDVPPKPERTDQRKTPDKELAPAAPTPDSVRPPVVHAAYNLLRGRRAH